jgi:hypothetical protein
MHAAKEKQQAMTVKRTHPNLDNKSKPKPADLIVPPAVFTIKEFCEAHRLSEAMYFKLRNAGLGPREMRALRKVTISIEAAERWRRERERAPQGPVERAA